MKYLCLIHADEQQIEQASADLLEEVARACDVQTEELRRGGQFIAAERLAPARDGVVVRVRDGRPTVTDGPFAETREQLAGFYLVEARDLNEAIRIASKIPPGRFGAIEVRRIRGDG